MTKKIRDFGTFKVYKYTDVSLEDCIALINKHKTNKNYSHANITHNYCGNNEYEVNIFIDKEGK